MNQLSARERELVALGAAIASNCKPCIEHHIPEARKLGLSGAEIREAVDLADAVRQVPARNVLLAASAALDLAPDTEIDPPEAAACAGLGRKPSRCC